MNQDKTISADVTPEEGFWVNVMRLNKAARKKEIRKKWKIGRLEITFHWQSRHNLMGRFGGGWQWVCGFEAGGRTVILNLLVCSLRLYWRKQTNVTGIGRDKETP